jgi:hypothetical protein
MCRKFFSSYRYLAWVVFFLLLSASLAESVTSQPSTNAKVDQDELAFIGTFPFQSRNLTIRNLDSEHPVVHVSLDKTDLLEIASDKMIRQDQIVFASQIVQDFGDFQIPAGGQVVISVSIEANPIFPYEPGTYKGKILVIIPNSTELTVPIRVDLKPSGIAGTISEFFDDLAKLSNSSINLLLSIIGIGGLGGLIKFYWDYRSEIGKRRKEAEDREENKKKQLEENKNKLNIDLKCRIVRSNNSRFVVILPSIENAGTNDVKFDLRKDVIVESSETGARVAKAPGKSPTMLSIKSYYSSQDLRFVDGGKPVQEINWVGEECTGSNTQLRRGEKIPPNEKFVEFMGNGIFVVKFVVKNEGPDAVMWPATVYGSTVETAPKS